MKDLGRWFQQMLVCSFGIKLFCFKKLMVKIYNIVRIGI
ncbi:hypothetical protein TFKS16_1256 [Tannerella forsythia KS16]|nr:hypothetical protein TF3313_0837 [Tannerella forsythia 3313]BAR51523.1 hypothetical protein TFKS16_1256 [Tannerella forsythia KS16]